MKTVRRTAALLILATLSVSLGVEAQDLERLYQSGLQAFQGGKAQEALELLGQVAAADPDYRDVRILLGQACLVTGRHLDAKRHFERALRADPGNAHAAFLLGLALYESARYFEASEALERAHELAPRNPHPSIYRGLSLLRLGRPDEARGEIETALSRAPGDPTARTALAELELAAGRLQSAEALVREVLAETPLGPSPVALDATLLLARILVADARPAEAVPVLQQALQSAERSDVLYLLARALLNSGRAEDGGRVMERFKQQKAFEEDVKLLEATLRADPDDVESRFRLVDLLLSHNQVRSALTHIAVLRKLRPGDPRMATWTKQLKGLP